ncbi:DUF6207 family protein [Streptomyces chryseus]|uniref:Uncharacterized protein n=1 Tax=Streptomyces chryseus TaxID=68186 RepID=A0ABQ3EGA7_9ACTN|nr:DUF6207 family protein [Streptomyces chryseus]GHB31429.1 hypothetical protein GCM10010346_63540 [Streptomyces chryseus]
MRIDEQHVTEPGLVVLDVTAADEDTIGEVMEGLQQLWATSGITPVWRTPAIVLGQLSQNDLEGPVRAASSPGLPQSGRRGSRAECGHGGGTAPQRPGATAGTPPPCHRPGRKAASATRQLPAMGPPGLRSAQWDISLASRPKGSPDMGRGRPPTTAAGPGGHALFHSHSSTRVPTPRDHY